MFKIQITALVLMLVGCSTAQCRKPAQIQTDGAPAVAEKLLAGPGRALVAKADGSKLCQKPDANTSKTVESMKADLKDIKIYDMANQEDTGMRTQVCGGAAGNYNVYEIAEEDLKKALARGFVRWPIMKKGSYDDR